MADTVAAGEEGGAEQAAPGGGVTGAIGAAATVLKDVVAALRDVALFAIGVLLLFAPARVKQTLEEAGFTKGEVLGFEWVARAQESTSELAETKRALAALQGEYEKLEASYREVVARSGDAQARTTLEARVREARPVVAAAVRQQAESEQVVTRVTRALSRVADARPAAETATWGLVLGGDVSLAGAQDEVKAFARLGVTSPRIYLRDGSYRTVAAFGERIAADDALEQARTRRRDAYVVDLARWCPSPVEHAAYVECRPR